MRMPRIPIPSGCPEVSTMFQKGERYCADWRSRKGKRLRKAFTSAEAALAYEEAQKAAARPKTRRGGRVSGKLSHRSSGRTAHAHTSSKRRSASSPSQATKPRQASARASSPTSTRGLQRTKTRPPATRGGAPRSGRSVTSAFTTAHRRSRSQRSRGPSPGTSRPRRKSARR